MMASAMSLARRAATAFTRSLTSLKVSTTPSIMLSTVR